MWSLLCFIVDGAELHPKSGVYPMLILVFSSSLLVCYYF